MWTLSKRWWLFSLLLAAPGVIFLIVGMANPSVRTDDGLPMFWFGVIWIFLQLIINGVLFGYLAFQKKRLAYFRENGIPAVATILAAETTGTTVNDMPQIELKLEIAPPDRMPYVITDRRCWNPLSLAGLQRGARLKVLVDPRRPKKILFAGDGDAPPLR